MKKFELIKTDKKAWNGEALFQIKANISFGSVKKGELGGYIAKEDNLSDDGDACVAGNARVAGDAWVYGNARVSGDAWVYGNAKAESGYWFATHEKEADITEIEMPDGYVTLVEDYQEPEPETKNPKEIEIDGA